MRGDRQTQRRGMKLTTSRRERGMKKPAIKFAIHCIKFLSGSYSRSPWLES